MTTTATYAELSGIQMMPEEVDYMVNVISNMPSDGLLVEWGSGGSTCKWLETLREQQSLISIEHNRDWYDKVSSNVTEYFGKLNNFSYFYCPTVAGYDHGYGGIEEENPFGLAHYVCPTAIVHNADLYFIDGIGRGACLATVLLKRKKPDSLIFMHDYILRTTAYSWISQFCSVEQVGTTLVKITG